MTETLQSTFFADGTCDTCGKIIFEPQRGKYPLARVISIGRNKEDGFPIYAWQFVCKNCGTVYIEPAAVVIKGQV